MRDGLQLQAMDMLANHSALGISEGLGFDGRYVYVTPHNDYIVAKIDSRTFEVVATLDLSKVNPDFIGMSGAFVAKGDLYILPHPTSSRTKEIYGNDVIRVDLDTFKPAGVSALKVMDATANYYGRHGFTDGKYGYVNIRGTNDALTVIRFGLGKDFKPENVEPLTLTQIAGFKILQANFLCCDDRAVYGIACVAHVPPAGPGTRRADLWLVAVPTRDFRAEAAECTRLTHLDLVGPALIAPNLLIDAEKELWTFPLPITSQTTTIGWLPPLRIPKKDPSKTVVTTPPAGQRPGSQILNSGGCFYDGKRYGYTIPVDGPSPEIMRVDTKKPGVVEWFSIREQLPTIPNSPLWGCEWDGREWAYAVSRNDANGLCIRFRPDDDGPRRDGDDDDDHDHDRDRDRDRDHDRDRDGPGHPGGGESGY